MNKKFVGLVALGFVLFACIRVYPYVRSRPSAEEKAVTELRKVIRHDKSPLPAIDTSPQAVQGLRDRMVKRIRFAVSQLPRNEQLSSGEMDILTGLFVDRVVLNRFGSREDYVNQDLFNPTPELIGDDIDKANTNWSYQTAWARQNPIDVESIDVRAWYINGLKTNPNPEGNSVSRRLANGTHLASDGAGKWSVFTFSVHVQTSSFSGEGIYDLVLYTSYINDGPDGEWSPVSCQFSGVPQGVFVYIPRP